MDNQVRQRYDRRLDIVKNVIRTTLLLAAMLVAGASASYAQVSLGIRIGPPPRPRVERVQPRSPGPDFVWVGGYWYPSGRRYLWHAGYYTQPPYSGARWVEPRHDGQQFFNGYWDGEHGRVEHDHKWDKDNGRDRDRHQDNGGHDDHDDHR